MLEGGRYQLTVGPHRETVTHRYIKTGRYVCDTLTHIRVIASLTCLQTDVTRVMYIF